MMKRLISLALCAVMLLSLLPAQTIALHGGIMERSIGYIALQNQDAFAEGTEADTFVEKIIDHVYGSQTA